MDDSQKSTQQTTYPGDISQNTVSSQPHTNQPIISDQSSQMLPAQPHQPPIPVDDTSQVSQKPEEKKEVPEVPVGAPSKEGGPSFPSGYETLVKPSTPDMEVSHELKEAGVESKLERPELTPADADTEIIQHAKESVPVVVSDQPNIHLPMTQQQAQQTVKLHKKVKDSLYWLAMLIARQWQIAQKGQGLKEKGQIEKMKDMFT